MKVAAFIPIKLNNERLPNKNIKPLGNDKPLINCILDTAISLTNVDEIYVYCSSDEIINYLPDGVAFLKRSERLDLSTTSITDVMKSFAADVPADIYVLLHATAPFLKKQSIELAVDAVLHDGHDSALSVSKNYEFLWMDGKPANYNVKTVPRTQDLSPFYIETTGLYVYTRELIMNENRRVGDTPFLVEVTKIEAIDINEPIDFEIASAVNLYLSKLSQKDLS